MVSLICVFCVRVRFLIFGRYVSIFVQCANSHPIFTPALVKWFLPDDDANAKDDEDDDAMRDMKH